MGAATESFLEYSKAARRTVPTPTPKAQATARREALWARNSANLLGVYGLEQTGKQLAVHARNNTAGRFRRRKRALACIMSPIGSLEWRNWQTREAQNLVAFQGREGSTPSSSTNTPCVSSDSGRGIGLAPAGVALQAARRRTLCAVAILTSKVRTRILPERYGA